MTGIVQTPFQFFPKNQRQETSEYVAPDVLIALVIHGPGFKQRLDIAKDTLDLPQLLVLKSDLFSLQVRVGGQHPFAVKARLIPDLVHVDAVLNGDLLWYYRK